MDPEVKTNVFDEEATTVLDDVLVCPSCGSDCRKQDVLDIDFAWTGAGSYKLKCECVNCHKQFKFTAYFDYNIRETSTETI